MICSGYSVTVRPVIYQPLFIFILQSIDELGALIQMKDENQVQQAISVTLI